MRAHPTLLVGGLTLMLGTLEPGFQFEPRRILTTPVDLTVVGGRVVFERR